MPDTTHRTYHDEEIVNPETHHEESDVNVRALLWFVAIFIVFAAVTHFALLMLFKFFVQVERGNISNAPLTSMQRPPDMDVPQTPRLQPFPTPAPPYRSTPVTDMEEMRAHEEAILNNYGWVDKQKGIVHIPIEQAKKEALQSGVFRIAGSQGGQGSQGSRGSKDTLDPLSPRPPAGKASNP
jgi:hypothetical protein